MLLVLWFLDKRRLAMEHVGGFAGWYFGIGIVINILSGILLLYQRESPGWKALLFRFILNMLMSPIVLAGLVIWFMVDPPTGNPDDLVYSHLDFYEGKAGIEIEMEICAAGESLGPFLVYSILDDLEKQKFARSERQQDGRMYYFRAGSKTPTKRNKIMVFLDRFSPVPV